MGTAIMNGWSNVSNSMSWTCGINGQLLKKDHTFAIECLLSRLLSCKEGPRYAVILPSLFSGLNYLNGETVAHVELDSFLLEAS